MACVPDILEADGGFVDYTRTWQSLERSVLCRLVKETYNWNSVFVDLDHEHQDVKRNILQNIESVRTVSGVPDFKREPKLEIDLRAKRSRLEMYPICKNGKTYTGEHSLKSGETLSKKFAISHYNGIDQKKRQQNHNVEEVNKGIHDLDIDANNSYWKLILKPDQDGDNLLFLSIINEHTHIFHVFINLVPNFKMLTCTNKMRQTALHLAALTENVEAVRRLVVAGAEVDRRDKYGNTALHIACKRGNNHLSNSLLTPVTYSEAKTNNYDIPYQKIPQNLEIRNSDGLTCLLIVAYKNDRSMMELLLSKDADINAIDMKSGKTCLHIFAESGNDLMIKFILSKFGLNMNARTYAGFTASEIAHYRGHNFVVSQLLYAGADPNIRPINSQEFLADSDSSDED